MPTTITVREIEEIEAMTREIEKISDRAMDLVGNSPMPESERRQEAGAVHSATSTFLRALERSRKAYQAGVGEATGTAAIARYPTPFKVQKKKKPDKDEREAVWSPWGHAEDRPVGSKEPGSFGFMARISKLTRPERSVESASA